MVKLIKLDKKDLRILKELFIDARKPLSQIGKVVGLSKQVVDYRINRLLKEGLIKGFTAYIDNMRMGYELYIIMIDLMKISRERETQLIDFLTKHPFIKYVASCSGVWDLEVVFCAKNIEHFDSLINEFMREIGENLLRYKVDRILREHVLPLDYLFGENVDALEECKHTEKVDFDEQDLIILAELEDNSRVTLPVIAKKAKLTSEAVKYRIQRLKKKKILLRFIPKLDISKLEYDDDLVYLYLQNKGKELEERLISYLKNNLNIISIIKCPIQRVIVFHIHTQTSDEIRNIIFELRESQQDIIKDMSSTSVFKVHKDSHLPDGFFKKH